MKAIALATFVAAAGLAVGVSGATVAKTGVFTGTTQISFGCPGPVSLTEPACNPWHDFPSARFSVARRSTSGTALPGTTVVVTSNEHATFRVRLGVGSYLVTPLPQHNTHGGPRLTLRVRAGAVTTALVRFVGYPRML